LKEFRRLAEKQNRRGKAVEGLGKPQSSFLLPTCRNYNMLREFFSADNRVLRCSAVCLWGVKLHRTAMQCKLFPFSFPFLFVVQHAHSRGLTNCGAMLNNDARQIFRRMQLSAGVDATLDCNCNRNRNVRHRSQRMRMQSARTSEALSAAFSGFTSSILPNSCGLRLGRWPPLTEIDPSNPNLGFILTIASSNKVDLKTERSHHKLS